MKGVVMIPPAGQFDIMLDANTAEAMRERAIRIRERHASVTLEMIEIGKELRAAKEATEHGVFYRWLEDEVGIAPRLAQMYMRAADWAKSNAKLISHLQPTSVMKLAAPSTPSTVLTLVAERIDAGEPVSAKAIDSLLRKAREEKQEDARLAKEAAVPKRTQEARKARREREDAERLEHYRKQAEAKQRADEETNELVRILTSHLDVDTLARVKVILSNEDVTRKYHTFASGVGQWRVRLVDKIEEAEREKSSNACFIQSVEDDIVNEGGIMDLWVREAHISKTASSTTPIVASNDDFTPPAFPTKGALAA